ncbi:uncharacterized protein N0V89_011512 [Didymosphaeria variabile]|uniref:NADH-ubiquinone oxidoreductase 17.8 kDa subunit n=1 Tax=Didymosphaeria variabile TaxID=1932322 RepID=A0A9W8X9W6_9PLEO|nr:uncharacterized protein N0V89_011512 [Didymosphaeria variabile]KAJ4345382.1 hypothetical protein N0V89_011512 [Didymosphaeria variabile]
MQALRRTAASAVRKGRTAVSRQQRRYAHDEHHHAHSEPVNESMGLGFWIPIGSIPVFTGLYLVSRGDADAPSILTRIINKYTEATERYAERNALHVSMIERAGSDRALFANTRPQEHVNMRFPEIMNQGSPFNVPAGQVNNMEKVIEKFKKEANEDNERKLQALRDDNIKSEQPWERFPAPGPENQRWPSKGVGSV